jgi:conserved domain protein
MILVDKSIYIKYYKKIYTRGVIIMSLEEKVEQAKGAVKEGIGKVTGDKKTESEGAAEKAASKVKEVVEDVKDAVEGTIEGVKNVINKDKK